VGIGRFGAMGGPILGGFVAGLQLGSFWNFLVFAAAAIAAAIAIIMTPAPAHER
jgi:AAHS family benzoate transporter-like MFS transporter